MFSGGTEIKHWLEISGRNIKNSSEERVERKTTQFSQTLLTKALLANRKCYTFR